MKLIVGANKLSVDFVRVIGKFYYQKDGKYYDTTMGLMHYDTKGNAHIVPARPTGFKL